MASLVKLVTRLTPGLKNALENAVGEAIKRKAAAIEVPHWLYHVIFGADVELKSFLEGQGVNLNDLQSELERKMPVGSTNGASQPTISGSVAKLMEDAWVLASVELGFMQVLPEVVLLAANNPTTLGFQVEPLAALQSVSTDALRAFAQERNEKIGGAMPLNQTEAGKSSVGGAAGDALSRFTVNLTQKARDGELDPVLGRTDEVANAIDILLRKRQNNPILLGEPGVGKTAIVEGLALKIISGNVPEQLKDVELLSLDMALLQAGASVKGEFEERLKNVIKEVNSSPKPLIMFIDEAHTMIGAGGAEGQNDAANLLKPALARGEFRCVAATTYAEYKKYMEKDPALARRFQIVHIDEPSRDASVNILRAVANGLSKHHSVFIRDDAVKAVVDLSIRFMPSRRLPDKAISLLDTACARVALSQHARPKQVERLEEELWFSQVELDKNCEDARLFEQQDFDGKVLEGAIEQQENELGAQISIWEKQRDKVEVRLGQARALLDNDENAKSAPIENEIVEDESVYVHPWVTERVVASVVSDWTGVPVSNLNANEAERLLHLEETLKTRVIGQDAAIETIARSLKISRAGLTDPRKPIGVFMICGPSGVGKTETALAIAEQFFGGEDAITTINMTEFKEAHKVSTLLGASAGYVGYGKGGVLTEAIRNRPYQVLLLGEMEKAHPEIQDIFFQIFDKGNITDSEGTNVDFRNTIIIMTSNAGGEKLRSFFEEQTSEPTAEDMKAHLRPLLLDHFSPAFIGRTELIAYRPLNEEVSFKLTEIHLNRIRKRVRSRYDAELVWDQSFIDFVVKANNDPLSGGRAIEAIINNNFLPKLAEECIARVISKEPLSKIHVAHNQSHIELLME